MSGVESITGGTIKLDGGSATIADPFGITIGSGAALTGAGNVNANLNGAGTVTANGGTLNLNGAVSGADPRDRQCFRIQPGNLGHRDGRRHRHQQQQSDAHDRQHRQSDADRR